MNILVTGGCGFIGTNLIYHLLEKTHCSVVNIDALTYAAHKNSNNSERYHFYQSNICDKEALEDIFKKHQPDIVIHLAAESHVDRSIKQSNPFIQSNIVGTHHLLEVSLKHFKSLCDERQNSFRFVHASTDEVYGSICEGSFNEHSSYNPSSPYSASKAASDHLVQAWGKTYGLPVIIAHSSNNYGPYQHAEKLIPKAIQACLNNQPIPIYGTGLQERDWIHVQDNVNALWAITKQGQVGETYCVSSGKTETNLHIIQTICSMMDRLTPSKRLESHTSLITHVEDRPGHDFRYAMSNEKLTSHTDWQPRVKLTDGIEKTVKWYLNHSRR